MRFIEKEDILLGSPCVHVYGLQLFILNFYYQTNYLLWETYKYYVLNM